jgi:hypothetical protein
LTGTVGLRDIEVRHPALQGAKSPMQTIRFKTASSDGTEQARPGPGRDLPSLLAGAAVTVGGVGAILALADSDSPLRGPFTLFFLLAAPAVAIAAALRGLDIFGRVLASIAGAVVVDMLVAQGMLAVHRWSVRGGIVAVTVLSAVIFLLVIFKRMEKVRSRRTTTSDKVV